MPYTLLADLVVLLHFAFVLFVLFGALLAVRVPQIMWLHFPAALWGAAVELGGWICPLTPLEIRFRYLAGQGGYESGFIGHYLIPLIYPPGLTRELQILLGGLVIGLNLGLYLWVWHRVRWQRRSD